MNSFIKSLMEERNLKQKELAEILVISPAAVSQWNEEGTNITTDNLFSLSKLFHVTVDELFEGKRSGESLEDKWKREYAINEISASIAMDEKEELLRYLGVIAKANDRFFALFEKNIRNMIAVDEMRELEYLKRFYQIKPNRNHSFHNYNVNEDNECSIATIADIAKEKTGGKNQAAILWELRNICKIVDFGIDESILTDFEDDLFYYKDNEGDDKYIDTDVFFAWYNILTPIEKDKIINAEIKENKYQRLDFLFELIKRGGNILYTPSDLNLTNFDYKDLDELEGVKPVPELDKAQSVIYEIYDNYSYATCEQYQAIINFPRMRRIEMEAKYKEKNPVKYWEYIKNNEVLV